jgi:hypothetical protein
MTEVTSPTTALSPASAEQPTSSARIGISLRPTEIHGTAEGIVPGELAPVLITTFGMISMGVAGIIGATITAYLGLSHSMYWFFGLGLAELGLALAVILLIARGAGSRLGRAAQATIITSPDQPGTPPPPAVTSG